MIKSSKAALIEPTVPIPHEDWNVAATEYRQNRPIICGPPLDGRWKYPWRPHSFEWDDNIAAWRIKIQPGFVNAREVEIPMRLSEAPDPTVIRSRLDPSIIYGRNRVNARLSESPMIPLRQWRRIGPDANSTGITLNTAGTGGTVDYESVHPFFLAMGVGTPPDVIFSTTTGIKELVEEVDRSEDRLLRACEIVLVQERPSVASSWTLSGGDGSIAEYDVSYVPRIIRETPYLDILTKYSPQVAQDPIERLRGNWQDEGRDELHIATIFAVSPPGADHGSEPDVDWEIHYQSFVFWNLNHVHNILPVTSDPEPLKFNIPPLAGGISQPIIDSIVGSLNDRYDETLEFIKNRSLEGRFWTT